MDKSAEEQHKGKRGRRVWARRLLVGLGVTAAALASWVAAHHVPRQLPPPLFTEADLPPLPPPGDNGWLMLAGPGAGVRPEAPPRDLVVLLHETGEQGPLLDRARAQRDDLSAYLGSPEALGALRALHQAVAMPRFADGCSPRLEPACLVFPLFQVRRIGSVEALRRGVEGDWPGALSLSARLTRADVDAATSSRSLLSHLIAVASLRQGLDVSAALLGGYLQARAQGAPPLDPAATEALRAADAALGGLDPAALSARRAVITEYLMTRSLIEQPSGEARLHMPGTPLLLDKAATLEAANRRFSELGALAAAPSAGPPESERPRDGALWWAYNPVGTLVLDALYLHWGESLRKLESDRALIEAARPRVRDAVRAIVHGS